MLRLDRRRHLPRHGLFNGIVSIRDQTGDEVASVQRNAPVWSVAAAVAHRELRHAWKRIHLPHTRVIAVGCWDGTLSFYDASTAQQVFKERRLGFDPCTVSYFGRGKYLLVGGSGRRVELRTHEGVKIADVAEVDGWVWACQARPKHNTITCGTEEGTITNVQLTFNTVHGLYGNRYAYREI